MIIVTGTAVGNAETIDALKALSLQHVRRSRLEPGCLAHNVHVDVENPLRLTFVEQWADLDALRAHFSVPASLEFVAAMRPLTTDRATMTVYDGSETNV